MTDWNLHDRLNDAASRRYGYGQVEPWRRMLTLTVEALEYARCLEGCARVLALRHAQVDHGAEYCTCGFMAAWEQLRSAEGTTPPKAVTGETL